MIDALTALKKLQEGNKRFVSGNDRDSDMIVHNDLSSGQEPFAIILGCSDSRVPAELVFDQGLGDLFVIRVAGNIVAPSQIGSVEFAADLFKTRLVVVLGHSSCGAISATIDDMHNPNDKKSLNIKAIVDRIQPSIEPFRATELWNDRDTLIHESMRANVRASVNQLRHGSAILENLIDNEGLLVVGAEYSLKTGEVIFFDHVPEK